MKVNPRLRWIAIAAFAGVGGLFVYSGGSRESERVAQSEQFKKRNNDFDRFAALRGEANKSQLAPIADEEAQKALRSPALTSNLAMIEPAPSAAETTSEEHTLTAPPAPELSKAECESAWDAGEACLDEAKAVPRPSASPSIPSPPPEASAKPEPVKAPARKARNHDYVELASAPPVAKPVPVPSPQPPPARGKINLAAYEEQLVAMSSPNSNVVTGRMTKSNMDILKKGSKYLGVINEGMAVRTGEKHPVTIDVISRLSNNTTVKPFVLYGEATLNKSGTKVVINVTDCIAEAANAGSLSCAGVIQNFLGEIGLDGELYSPDRYALAVKTAGLIFGGVLQGMKTTSRTLTGGVLYDQTFGNGVIDAMSNAAIQAGNEEAANAKAKGDEIKIAPGAFVRVLIGEDVALW